MSYQHWLIIDSSNLLSIQGPVKLRRFTPLWAAGHARRCRW